MWGVASMNQYTTQALGEKWRPAVQAAIDGREFAHPAKLNGLDAQVPGIVVRFFRKKSSYRLISNIRNPIEMENALKSNPANLVIYS